MTQLPPPLPHCTSSLCQGPAMGPREASGRHWPAEDSLPCPFLTALSLPSRSQSGPGASPQLLSQRASHDALCRAHPNPKTEGCEGAKSLRNAILRLVPDTWKVDSGRAWAGQCPGGLPGFPGLRVLTPCLHPAFPLGSHPQPVLATGNRMALVPRG